MIVRITRLLLLIQFLAAVGVCFAVTRVFQINTALAALIGIGFVVLFRILITANNFFLAWRYRSMTPERYQIAWWEACRLFAGEFRATMTASSWMMPFRIFSKRPAPQPQGLPVLLIHGYGCNSGYWHAMSKALSNANITHHAIDMEPVIGGIDEYAPPIHVAIERLCRETGHDKIVIVAHSMGGLAARSYLRIHGPKRIAKAITLGTPHHGTGLAHFGVGLNTHQMRWTATEQEGLASEWLRELAASETPSIRRLFVSIYSHHDNIISPQTSSHLPDAKNIEFHAIGHVALALHPRIHAQVIREIREASHQAQTKSAKASQIS